MNENNYFRYPKPARILETNNTTLKVSAQVTFCLFAVLLCGAWFFFKQRMLFSDAALILFQVINKRNFEISDRYGSVITQVFPFVAARLHLPLRAVALLYSSSFVVIYLFAGILLWRIKRFDLIILSGLYATLFCTQAYYWTNNEVHQGIPILLCTLGITGFMAEKKWPLLVQLPLMSALFFLSFWTHPLIMIPGAYLWFVSMVKGYKKPYSLAHCIMGTVVVAVLGYLKWQSTHQNTYDQSKVGFLSNLSLNQLTAIVHTDQFVQFTNHLVVLYWPALVMLVVSTVILLRKRAWWIVVGSWLAIIAFLALICLTYPTVGDQLFYVESEYMLISIFFATPFVLFVLPELNARLALWLLVAVFAIRVTYIFGSSGLYTRRVVENEHIISKMREKHITKLIIPVTDQLQKTMVFSWAASIESVLLSAMEGDKPNCVYIIMQPFQTHILGIKERDKLLSHFEDFHVSRLNSYYFTLDTTVAYQVSEYDQLMK